MANAKPFMNCICPYRLLSCNKNVMTLNVERYKPRYPQHPQHKKTSIQWPRAHTVKAFKNPTVIELNPSPKRGHSIVAGSSVDDCYRF